MIFMGHLLHFKVGSSFSGEKNKRQSLSFTGSDKSQVMESSGLPLVVERRHNCLQQELPGEAHS